MSVYSNKVEPYSDGLSPLDERLLKLASQGKSAQEMATAVNMLPADALLRVREILSSRDIWSERERFLMYLDDLYSLKEVLNTEARATNNQQAYSNLIRALDQLGRTLKDVTSMSDRVADKITETQAKFLVGVVVSAFDYAKSRLAEEYPDVPWEVVNEKLREGLVSIEQ